MVSNADDVYEFCVSQDLSDLEFNDNDGDVDAVSGSLAGTMCDKSLLCKFFVVFNLDDCVGGVCGGCFSLESDDFCKFVVFFLDWVLLLLLLRCFDFTVELLDVGGECVVVAGFELFFFEL